MNFVFSSYCFSKYLFFISTALMLSVSRIEYGKYNFKNSVSRKIIFSEKLEFRNVT